MAAAQPREDGYLQSHSPGGSLREGTGDYSSRGNSLCKGQGAGGSLGHRENHKEVQHSCGLCVHACVCVCVRCACVSVDLGVGKGDTNPSVQQATFPLSASVSLPQTCLDDFLFLSRQNVFGCLSLLSLARSHPLLCTLLPLCVPRLSKRLEQNGFKTLMQTKPLMPRGQNEM